MITHNLGYPRIGNHRELKKAVEGYWAGRISYDQLMQISSTIKQKNWLTQKDLGIDLIPSNDFSLYDHVLDLAFAISAIPDRYAKLPHNSDKSKLDLYFAMARGLQDGVIDITAMEMTKWFDTNYHYFVPEFYKNQKFWLSNFKLIDEYQEAKKLGINTKPVILGPVSFLLLGKEKEEGFDRIDLLGNLLDAYFEMISLLVDNGVEWIQLDEPFLALDLTPEEKGAFKIAYSRIRKNFPSVKLLLSIYFGGLSDNVELVAGLPVDVIHLDLVRDPAQLEIMMDLISGEKKLSLGLVDGRNIWKNNYGNSLKLISKAIERIGEERLMLAPSCSLLHVPCDLELETNEEVLSAEIKQWLAFAKQKIEEVVVLKQLSVHKENIVSLQLFKENREAIQSRRTSGLIYNDLIIERIDFIEQFEEMKRLPFPLRKKVQQKRFELPPFPTTTIGSFPQTADVRSWRAKLKKNELSGF